MELPSCMLPWSQHERGVDGSHGVVSRDTDQYGHSVVTETPCIGRVGPSMGVCGPDIIMDQGLDLNKGCEMYDPKARVQTLLHTGCGHPLCLLMSSNPSGTMTN